LQDLELELLVIPSWETSGASLMATAHLEKLTVNEVKKLPVHTSRS